MKTTVIILGLLVVLAANVIMVYFAPYGMSPLENFQNAAAAAAAPAATPTANAVLSNGANAAMPASPNAVNTLGMANGMSGEGNLNKGFGPMPTQESTVNGAAEAAPATEGFASYALAQAGGARDQYQPMGSFDGIKLSTGNSVSGWRYTAPNEPLMGAEFEPGPDSLFIFKNNQCKPECCGASFSCGGGCVCTTPQQRQYIAGRGGNRTAPEDSA
jgi:hypothetical protein